MHSTGSSNNKDDLNVEQRKPFEVTKLVVTECDLDARQRK